MVQVDSRYPGDLSVCGGYRIIPPTEPSFENCELNINLCKRNQCDSRDLFKIGGNPFYFASFNKQFGRLANASRKPRKFAFADIDAVDAHTFGYRNQMRRRENSGLDFRL